ncbi:trypsin-like serine protease [Bdellovibrio bacteriovorus]
MANLCTGVVVSKRIVLSAANCFSDQLDIEPVQVVFPGNKTYVESNTLTGSVEIHPKYDDNDGSYNLAVIRLNEDIPSQAQPIEIGEVEDLASLKRVYTGGYGLFYVVKPAELWEQQIHFSMEDGLFRFTSVDGRESCKGDDGGPIVSVDEGGKARLVGITTLSLLDCTGWNLNHLPMYKVKDYLRLYLAEAE